MSSSRLILVSGGSRGIGRAISIALLREGYLVATVSRLPIETLGGDEDLGELQANWTHLSADLRRLETIPNLITQLVNDFGRLDGVVNCAGITSSYGPEESEAEHWNEMFEINVRSAFFLCKAALPYLKEAPTARIVNIASSAGRMGGYLNSVEYAASKGALIAMTYALARKLAKHQITVNCVAPGPTRTEMMSELSSSTYDPTPHIPIGRLGLPDEVAQAVIYFLSENSYFTTGAVLDVNGGIFMG